MSEQNPVLLDDFQPQKQRPESTAGTESDEVLQYPPHAVSRVVVTRQDLIRLAPECFLNDSLVDFYFSHVMDSLSVEHRESYHAFSSLWYLQVASYITSGKTKKKWSKEMKALEKKYIVIPIIEEQHWSLIIITNLKNATFALDKSDPTETQSYAEVLHFDSFTGVQNMEKIFLNLRNFFTQLLKNYLEVNSELSKDEIEGFQLNSSNFKYAKMEVPQQMNSVDCGLHVMKTFTFFLDQTKNAEEKDLVLRKLEIKNCEIDNLREEVYDLIKSLSKAENIIPYEEFKTKYRNHFKENGFEYMSTFPRMQYSQKHATRKTRVVINLKQIVVVHSVRDVSRLESSKKEPRVSDANQLSFSVIVSKESSTRYSLSISYAQAKKISVAELFDEFLSNRKWRCQKCKEPNKFYSFVCCHCKTPKMPLRKLIQKLRQMRVYNLNKALTTFYDRSVVEKPMKTTKIKGLEKIQKRKIENTEEQQKKLKSEQS